MAAQWKVSNLLNQAMRIVLILPLKALVMDPELRLSSEAKKLTLPNWASILITLQLCPKSSARR